MSQSTPLRLIKRYGNRKLYDTSESRYITLDEIARLVRSGNDVKVIDNENGDDLTAITYAQIILEEEKRRSSLISLGLLRELVQHGEDTLAPQRRLEALQRSIDERIKSSVGRITNHPVVQHEVQRIERSIKKLEERLARLRREEDASSHGGDAVG